MISVPTWINANSALSYHTEAQDNYYQKEGDLGTWQGKGAQKLGFEGAITKEDLKNALFGKDKEGNQVLQVKTDEKGDRIRAGLDLTFSAPKSLSIAYEAAQAYGDKEKAKALREAHEKAVAKILDKIEDKFTQTRVTAEGKTKRVDTDNLAIAKFTHETARPVKSEEGVRVDPSLHTHAVLMNMTETNDEKWRALEAKILFENGNYIKLGMNYRNELAANLKELGYDIRVTDVQKGFFELKHIDDKLIEEFSKRSEQLGSLIDELKEKYPNKSDMEIKQMAAWKSREWKGKLDREEILENNRLRIESLGFSKEDILPNKINDKDKLPTIDDKQTIEKTQAALNNALTALSDQESVFDVEKIIETAGKFGLKDGIRIDDIQNEIKSNKNAVNLTENYYTTKEIIKAEKELIKDVKNHKDTLKPVYETKKEAKELIKEYSKNKKEQTGYALTTGQQKAAAHILSSKDLVIGIQGDAGTGKTTMLKAVNELSKDTKLIGLSYTGKAASEIQKATASKEAFKQAGIQSETIARFLRRVDKLDEHELREFAYSKLIVDEASMLGTKDTKRLIDFAKRAKAQIVLMGDVKQLKAINAGSPFELLQKNGLKTVVMSEVLRQKDKTLKKAVKSLNNYDSNKAFNILDKNGLIKESENSIDDVKEEFFKHNDKENTQALISAKESYKDSIILTNTNKMKDELNSAIRKELEERGEIGKDSYKITTKESTRLKPSETYLSESYESGNSIFIQKSIDSDLKAGSEFKIVNVDNDNNSITLSNGKIEKEISLSDYGSHLQQYREVEREFAKGDKIVFTKNDKRLGVNNGETAIIKAIDDKTGMLHLDKDGQELSFSVNDYRYIDYGYAITTHKSQGQTAKNVVAYMDSKTQNFNSFYVTVTRATDNLKIFTDDKEELKKFIEIEQEKLNAIEAVENLAKKEEEWSKNNTQPATSKQLKVANNISKALNLEFDSNDKYSTAEFIKDNFENYKEYLNNQPATHKQIEFAEKIGKTLGIEFEGNTKKEIKEFLDRYSNDFTEYINDRTGYLIKTDPNSLNTKQQDKYFKDYYHEISRCIAKEDIDNLDRLYDHLNKVDENSSDIYSKSLQIEAYQKTFRITNKEIVEQLADKYFGEDETVKNMFAKNPMLLYRELKDNDLDYAYEKEMIKADMIKEKYEEFQYEKMGNAKDEKEFDEAVNKQEKMESFIEKYKEDLQSDKEYRDTIGQIEEHLDNANVYEASKLIEEKRENLTEEDLERLETKLENMYDSKINDKADIIKTEIERETDSLIEELESYFEEKEERLEAENTETKEKTEEMEADNETENTKQEEMENERD